MPILFSPRFTRVCQATPIHFLNVTFPQKLSLKIVLLKKLLLFKNFKKRLFLYGLSSQKLELVTNCVPMYLNPIFGCPESASKTSSK